MTTTYKPYPAYKDSGVEWLGEIPEGWDLTRLKFESLIKARVGWHGLKSDEFTDIGPYLVTGTDFKGPEIQWENCYHCDDSRYEQDPYIQLRNGDLLITKDGTIGKVALVQNLYAKATLNSGIFVVRPLSNRYTSKFYFWLLQSTVFHGFVNFYKTGSTIAHLYQNVFENLSFALPNLVEQIQIANFLDHETARIDTLIAKQKKLIALLKEKRQAVISHAVTKGLNPDVEMKDSGVEWLGEVPAHWEVLRAKFLFEFVTSGSRGWAEYYSDKGSLFFRIANLTRETIEPKLDSIQNVTPPFGSEGQRAKICINDLLISITADLGSVCVADEHVVGGYVSQHVALCRPNSRVSSARWLGFFILSDTAKEQLLGSGYGGTKIQLSLQDIRDFWVVRPPNDEQVLIDCFLTQKLEHFSRLRKKAIHQINLLQERRTALISAAVTGKIDLRDWQGPQEQSAKVLVGQDA